MATDGHDQFQGAHLLGANDGRLSRRSSDGTCFVSKNGVIIELSADEAARAVADYRELTRPVQSPLSVASFVDSADAFAARLDQPLSHHVGEAAPALRDVFAQAAAVIRNLAAALAARPPEAGYPDGYWQLRVEHARTQGAANGFQQGWHGALARIRDGSDIDELSSLVPELSKRDWLELARLAEEAAEEMADPVPTQEK